ncbi:cellulose-binding domain-containing protein [Actinomycetes bacterium KLBMP 9797]
MKILMRVAAAVVVAAAASVALVQNGHAAAGCLVDYQTNQWSGGFTATVRVTAGDAAVNGWTVTWTYGGDQRITSGWSATVTQSGAAVTATNLAWNGALPAGGSTEFGLQGTYAASNAAPTGFALNGEPCNGAGPAPTTVPPTSSPPPTTPPPSGEGCAGAVLCDGFEGQTGTTPSGAWAVSYPDCQGTGTAAVDSAVAHSGTKSVRVNGTAGYCNHVFVGATQNLGSVGAVRYARLWVRHTTALPQQHVTFLAMRDASDGNRDLRMGGQNGALQWNRASDDATLPEQSPAGVALSLPLPVNQWSCVEFMVDGAQGQLRTWLNGNEVAGLVADGTPTHDIDSQWLARANWRPSLTDLRLGWESYGEGADTLWFDDVAMSTTRVGC